ncbi:MAG TPA: hypothetical protein VGM19_10105 [Armatimonadota bacterium]|jgi:anti-sigma factor RsiW
MNCTKVRSLVVLDDEHDSKQREALEQHLDRCPQCRRFAQDMGHLAGLLQSVGAQQPPADFSRSVMARIRKAEQARPASAPGVARVGAHSVRIVPVLAAAVLVTGVGLGAAMLVLVAH